MARKLRNWGWTLGILALALAPAAAAQAQGRGQPPAPQRAPAPAPAQPPAQPDAAPQQPAAVIDGFRSAKFGMTEAEVRAAIRKDFNTPENEITRETNPVERTPLITIRAKDLLPDTGPATVTYIFGFRSKKLMQVNLAWATTAGQAREPLQVVVGSLRNYFSSQSFKRDSVVVNRPVAAGVVVLFRGGDEKGRTVRLMSIAPDPPAQAQGQPKPPLPPAQVSLTYIENLTQPDIYRIQPGMF